MGHDPNERDREADTYAQKIAEMQARHPKRASKPTPREKRQNARGRPTGDDSRLSEIERELQHTAPHMTPEQRQARAEKRVKKERKRAGKRPSASRKKKRKRQTTAHDYASGIPEDRRERCMGRVKALARAEAKRLA